MNTWFLASSRARSWSAACALVLAGVFGLMSGCGAPARIFPSQENFGSANTYSRLFDVSAAQTCEAARRALLSQGSASLGVGAFGSVSLPFSSSSDSMVRVGSETITSDAFYDRFFELVRRYLVVEVVPVKVP